MKVSDIQEKLRQIAEAGKNNSSPNRFLGDTLYLRQAEVCECGETMQPRVIFGRVAGWRCSVCNPMRCPTSYSLVDGKAVINY